MTDWARRHPMREWLEDWYWRTRMRMRIRWGYPPCVERAFKTGYRMGWRERAQFPPESKCDEDAAFTDYVDQDTEKY